MIFKEFYIPHYIEYLFDFFGKYHINTNQKYSQEIKEKVLDAILPLLNQKVIFVGNWDSKNKFKNIMKLILYFKKLTTDKKILVGVFITLVYFLFLLFILHFKINYVIIGVFTELLTIPFFIIPLILLFFTIKNWRKEKWIIKSNYIISLIVLILIFRIIIYLFKSP